MAWTAPRTWVTGEVVTAAQLNTHLRDNIFDLDRRTSPIQSIITTGQGTTSAAYTDMATVGPAVTVTVGTTGKVLVALYSAYSNGTSNFALMSYAVSGATTVGAADTRALQTATPSDVRNGMTVLEVGLNPGSTTFTAKYRSTGGTAGFSGRFLWVTPLGS